MKILYITTKATYGGVQTHIKQCASYMKNNGHEVLVMAHSNSGVGLEKDLSDLKIPFIANNFLKNSFNPINGIFTIFKIRKVIKKFKPDLVSCHSSSAGFWGRLAILNQVPVIFTAHGWGFTKGVGILQEAIVRIAEKIVSPLCKKIICVSENDKNIALKHNIAGEHKLITIHNGVCCLENSEGFENSFNLNLGKKIPIVFIGRLSGQKNPEQLIEAFNQLPEKLQENSMVYIIGDGEKRQLVESLIISNNLSDRVTLLGELPHNKVFQFLSECLNNSTLGCGIFALISQYEGFPRSILEAMGFGYAVITSDVGGVREVVSDDVGILVERNDVQGIKDNLEFLLNNPEKIKQLGMKAKEKINTEFSLEKMFLKTEDVYKSIV